MKEIPNELMTAILPDVQLNRGHSVLPIGFVNRRRANKNTLRNKIWYQKPEGVEPEYITLKNTGFTLELERVDPEPGTFQFPEIYINHPDLPKRENYRYGFIPNNDVDFWKVLSLISQSAGMVRGKLNGTFYYDPGTKFFVLENDLGGSTSHLKEIGEKLSGTWTKIIPGHEYYIELGPYNLKIYKAVYLGEIDDVSVRSGWNSSYRTEFPKDFDLLHTSGVFFKDSVRLFRVIEPEETYMITTKKQLRGIDLGDCGETLDRAGYEELCEKIEWFTGMTWDLDKLKKYIVPLLSELVKDRGGKLYSYNILSGYSSQALDLNLYSSSTLYNLLQAKINAVSNGSRYWNFGEMNGFCRLFDKACLGDIPENDIKAVFHEVFIECFGRD